MNAIFRKSVAAYLAALAIGFVVVASTNPSAANPPPPSPHPVHMHQGFGPWIGLGLFGAAVAGGYAYDSCVAYQPIYDRWGNYLGRQAVDVCN